MQQNVDDRDRIALVGSEAGRKARALLPLLIAPCLPAIVACSTAEMRANPAPRITPEVVARTGLPPLLMRPLSKSAAEALNQRIPFSAEPVIAPPPFRFAEQSNMRDRALECLTSAIYYEAASESDDGERAVAQVVLNRVRHPAFPASVCGVVYQGATLPTGCQFSFTCDGSLQRMPSRREWDRARAIAAAALAGAIYAPVGLATHYHTDQVVPYWAPSLAKAVQVGAHIFYRWAGDWGRPTGFTQRYSRNEGDPLALRGIALLSHNIWPSHNAAESPRLALTINPDVELNGILHVLASDPSAGTTAYEKAIRSHFTGEPAERLFRQLGGDDRAPDVIEAQNPEVSLAAAPETLDDKPLSAAAAVKKPSLAELVRKFGREMRLAAFLRAQRANYKVATEQIQQLAEQSAFEWEIYARTPVPARKAVLSLSQGLGDASCPALAMDNPVDRVLRWPADARGRSPADVFLASGLAADSLVAPPATGRKASQLQAAVGPVEDQVVAAVFARIAALSRGEGVGDAVLRQQVAEGHTLVPLLTKRLRFFERHRADYPTLKDFLPRLVADLPKGGEKKAPASQPERCTLTAAVPVADPLSS